MQPFNLFQRDVYDIVKDEVSKDTSTYEIKSLVGQRWRALGDEAKAKYVRQAHEMNKDSRSRKAAADPAQLLVRHEMCARS